VTYVQGPKSRGPGYNEQKTERDRQLSADTIRKAKVLAAHRSTSVNGLLAEQIESLVAAEEAYERSERAALAVLDEGFILVV
jgi:hypothetical protein